MAVTVVLLLGVIFGMVGLAVDAGQIYKVRTQAQNAADASALAAAGELDGTAGGITAARDEAIAFANNNRVYDGAAVIAGTDVVFGRWSPVDGEFTALDEAAVTRINAVRVRTTPAAVKNPFMSVFGRDDTDVNAVAIASAGGAAAECSSPLMLADCMPAAGEMSHGNCGACLKFQSATSDTAGWTNLGSGSVSPGVAAELLKSSCSNLIGGCDDYDDTATECNGACTAPTVDQSVGLYNGNGLNEGGTSAYGADNCAASLNNPCEVVKEILLRESTGELAVDSDGAPIMVDGRQALKGKYFTITAPMFDDDHGGTADPACDPNFSGSAPIEGYTMVDIFSVQCQNAGGGGGGKGKGGGSTPAGREAVVDPDYMETYASELSSLTCDTVPSGKHLLGRVYCDSVVGRGGGGMPGRVATIPRLVK